MRLPIRKRFLPVILIICLLVPIPVCVAEQLVVPDGAVGVWCIPEIRMHMPVYTAPNGNYQEVIDEPESALMRTWCGAYRIGDHCGSIGMDGKGWWRMDNITVGSKGWMLYADGDIRTYECYMIAIVDVHSWGYTVNGEAFLPHSSLDILNTCCVESDSTRNYAALFRYVGRFG